MPAFLRLQHWVFGFLGGGALMLKLRLSLLWPAIRILAHAMALLYFKLERVL